MRRLRGARRPGAPAPAEVAARRSTWSRAGAARTCRRSPASTPPSTPACRRPPRPTRCRASGGSGWQLRRFGFHGLSHAYASRRAAELAGPAVDELRIVTCHLGAGASLARRATTASRSTRPWASRRSRGSSWRPAPARSTRGSSSGSRSTSACRRPSSPRRSSTARASSACRARPTWRRSSRRRRRGDDGRASRRRGLPAPAARRDRGDGGRDGRARRARLHGRRRRARARRSARAPPTALGFLGVELDARNDDASGDAEIGSGSVRTFVIAAREDLQIARGVRSALAFEDHEHG